MCDISFVPLALVTSEKTPQKITFNRFTDPNSFGYAMGFANQQNPAPIS